MVFRFTAWAVILLVIALFCHNPVWGQTPPPKTPELLSKGRKLYEQKRCSSCHGIQGNAQGPMAKILKPPPRDFTLPLKDWAVSRGDPIKIFKIIEQGIPDTAMVRFNLPQEDIWALVYAVMEFSSNQERI